MSELYKKKISQPVLKFIGDKEMVIPVIDGGYILSHKDYVNYFYPEVISIIDRQGMLLKFQKAELFGGIKWWASIKNVCLMHRTRPLLIDEPKAISLEDAIFMVCAHIDKTPASKGLPNDEKEDMLQAVRKAGSHAEIIDLINSVSYWK